MVSILPLLNLVVVMEYFHQIIFIIPWTIFLLKIGESTNITSKAVPLGNILCDEWVNGNIIFFSGCNSFWYFWYQQCRRISYMWFPIPTSSISILHFVARIFWRKLYNFALLNAEDSGKHQNLQAIFTLLNITYDFSKVIVGLPGVC